MGIDLFFFVVAFVEGFPRLFLCVPLIPWCN